MVNRRQLLSFMGSAAGLGLLPAPGVRLLAQEATFSDYRCLVNIFLLGGNDSFNLVVPRSNAEYNVYAASRQNLALAQQDLLPIFPDNPDGAEYGLHPIATGLQTLFDQGDAAIIANIGPLIEPVSKDGFLSGTAVTPPQLFSHNDQQGQWQSLRGKSSLTSGWAGRIADVLSPLTGRQQLALNTSAAGTTLFQAGEETIAYSIGTEGADAYSALAETAGLGLQRRAAFDLYLSKGFDNIHSRALAAVHQRSLATADLVNDALELVPVLQTVFPQSSLGQQMKIVARLIAVKDEFQMTRQIFHVASHGFDTHDDQNQVQPSLLADLSQSITAFNAAMNEIGQSGQVVTFTQSDFGRTLTSNGNGTDHGWGGHQIVVGGSVAGRKIYGDMPSLEIGGEDDATGGRIIPTLSVDQYAATLARWFGVDESMLNQVAPSLMNFSNRNLGFL
jgi:uncharacterized protein (DUF1501 family)